MTIYLLYSYPAGRRLRLDDLIGSVAASSADEAATKLGLRIVVTSDNYLLRNSEEVPFIMTQPTELKSSKDI